MAHLALTALLAALAAASPATAWTPEVQTQANLGGSITALSLQNNVIPGRTAVSLPIDSFGACVKGCSQFANGNGCNTVVFCANSAGCGNAGECTQAALGPYSSVSCTSDGKFPYAVSIEPVGW